MFDLFATDTSLFLQILHQDSRVIAVHHASKIVIEMDWESATLEVNKDLTGTLSNDVINQRPHKLKLDPKSLARHHVMPGLASIDLGRSKVRSGEPRSGPM